MVFFALLFSSTAFVSLPLSILTFSVFGRLAATCSALILPLVLFCVWCCCCFCLSRVLVFDFLCPLVGRSAGQPVNRAFRRSTGQPPRSAGQPGNRAFLPLVGRSAGQPVNRAFRRSTGQPPRSTGQPPRSAGQPGNRATGQPGRGGVNRDPVSRLPGPVGRLPPYSKSVCKRSGTLLAPPNRTLPISNIPASTCSSAYEFRVA